jgi:tetratricopeptide (TPR) repeat protein
LQGLFESIGEEIDRLQAAGRMSEASGKARAAVVLAEQLHEWALRRDPPLSESQLYAIELQLAEAHLRAEHWDTAKRLFDRCVKTDADQYEDGLARDRRALLGLAEALYGMERYADALPLFNRVVRSGTVRGAGADWWRALLRDLQCRTALDHESEGIIKVIEQHRVLDSRMGGAALKEQFDQLEGRNRKRLEGSETDETKNPAA